LAILFAIPHVRAWNLSTASYSSKSVSVNGEATFVYGLIMSVDGTKMYFGGYTNGYVYQYNLSTAWDISTATYANKRLLVTGQTSAPLDVGISHDGLTFYVQAGSMIYQYGLSSAWDLSSATYANKSYSTSAQESLDCHHFIDSSGTRLFVVGSGQKKVFQYTLSSAWDISTASYDGKNKAVSTQAGLPYELSFKTDGTKMYVSDFNTNRIYQYTLSSAWDVSTATYDTVYFSFGSQETYPTGLHFRENGANFYVMGRSNTPDKVFQYAMTDAFAPAVSSLSPADNATGVSLTENLVITFDENTRAGTGTLTIKKTLDDSTVETITVSGALLSGNGTTQLTFNPNTSLAEYTGYYVVWSTNAFKDTSGNNTVAQTSTTYWNFTTADLTAPVVSAIASSTSSTGATITWSTNESGSSLIQYGTTSALGSTTAETDTSTRVKAHSVSLTSLPACSTYFYRPISKDVSSNAGIGSLSTFMTTGCTNSAAVNTQTGSSVNTTGGSLTMTRGGQVPLSPCQLLPVPIRSRCKSRSSTKTR